MDREDARLARHLGAAVRAHRRNRRWSQARLAESVDITTNYVSLIERGERLPTVGTVARLARALGATPDQLLGFAEADEWTSRVLGLAAAVPGHLRRFIVGVLEAAANDAPERIPVPPRSRR